MAQKATILVLRIKQKSMSILQQTVRKINQRSLEGCTVQHLTPRFVMINSSTANLKSKRFAILVTFALGLPNALLTLHKEKEGDEEAEAGDDVILLCT